MTTRNPRHLTPAPVRSRAAKASSTNARADAAAAAPAARRGRGGAATPVAAVAAPPGARAAREGRLNATDWIEAGQALLRERGIAAIKLAALTERLGVSTGSFYHHFADFEQYLGALADHYSVERIRRDLDSAVSGPAVGPIERLQRLARRSLLAGTFDLDRAMRIWATMDPRAEAATRRSEALVLDFVTGAFAELGFDRAEAALRARILLSVNVSPLAPPADASRAAFYRGCLRLLTQDAPAARTAPRRRAVAR